MVQKKLEILEPEFQKKLLEDLSELQNWFLHQTDMNDPYCRAALGRTTTLLLDLKEFCDLMDFTRVGAV